MGMRSIRNRLALLIAAIVAMAIGFVYFYVVPQLESRLRSERLQLLAADTGRYDNGVRNQLKRDSIDTKALDRAVEQAGNRANVRVTLLEVHRSGSEPRLTRLSDSTTHVDLSDLDFQVADEALLTKKVATGSESSNDGPLGQAARPLFFDKQLTHVLVFSAPFDDVEGTVALVRRQVIVAGLIALAFAMIAGWFVARALSRRVKRLEQAAEKVAGGDFSQRIPIERDDELGELAVAFNDMQRQLAQLDRARKQFIAVASHELRTPIFSLGGFVELLEEEELDDDTRAEFIRQIREQTDRLTKLATHLLDLSRLEAGSLELRPEPTDVADVARSVAAEFTPALTRHRSELALRVSAADAEVEVDPERLAQIVRILIDNAITHTPAGTDVTVTAARENGHVRLAVEDTGPGIRRASLPHLFEPFYTSDEAHGSGLGLAIARELAERMEGHLAVHSGPGRTTFTLDLPA
jgi:two-component system OmpR family sensor kinase